MMQLAAGPPVDAGPRMTGAYGVNVTVPFASGTATVKAMPAQAVPARPTPGESTARMGSAGNGRGSGAEHGRVPELLHDGFRRMLLTTAVWVAMVPWELWVIASAAAWFWAPTAAFVGNSGNAVT